MGLGYPGVGSEGGLEKHCLRGRGWEGSCTDHSTSARQVLVLRVEEVITRDGRPRSQTWSVMETLLSHEPRLQGPTPNLLGL